MDYEERIAALFERHRSVQTAGFSSDAYKPGLQGMMRLDSFLGHPHSAYPTIHIAGTNGKGSVCSMIAAALAAAGLRVGLYTSPHLLDFRERMKLVSADGWSMPSREDVCEFLDLTEGGPFDKLSFFEITTGLAFWWFRRQKVDAAVIETGLGGRLDSTNIITPQLAVVTSIGLDHCDLLGPTREAIAAEKAGIFKPGIPALVWGRDDETQPVFERAAAGMSPLFYAEDFEIPGQAGDDTTETINRRTASAALELLKGILPSDRSAFTEYRQLTGFRARWEIIRQNPLTIVDIGHNPPALAANFARLGAMRLNPSGDGCIRSPLALTNRGPDTTISRSIKRPLLIVYGAMADKDVDSIVSLMPRDAAYHLVAPGTPRAMRVEDLALKLKNLNFTCHDTVEKGVAAALSEAATLSQPIIYIGGSTYVAAEAISYLEQI